MTHRKTIDGYRVGSQPPEGYVAWHEWAAAQAKGGLRQKQCPTCGLWRFPQEKCDHRFEDGSLATAAEKMK